MSLWGKITGLFTGGIGGTVKDVGSVFSENKEARGQRAHDADMQVLQQFAAEFRDLTNRSWWDSFIDGLNRLPRPLITLGVFGLFILAPIDPVQFLKIAQAYEAMPEGFWALLSIIVAFYFGGRLQMSSQRFAVKGGALAAAKNIVEQRKEFRKLEADDEDPMPDVVPTGGNAVVDEWLKTRR